MEIGWRIIAALIAGIGAGVISPPSKYERFRDFALHWWPPYIGLVVIGNFIGWQIGIL